jgi:CRP/FNR family cyclic AMP-dependent transcriptional regulator
MLTTLEKVDMLRKAQIFQGVPTESLARVAAIAQEVGFEVHQQLFSAGDAADSMFVLLEGQVALVREGRETDKLSPYEVVGAQALLAGDSQPVSAVTAGPLRALRIDQQDFYDAMAEDFNITRGILRALVGSAARGE